MPHGGARRGAGRPKKPLELKLLEGTWRKDRDGELPTGVTVDGLVAFPDAPPHLTPEQRALWADLAQHCGGWVRQADWLAVSGLVSLFARLRGVQQAYDGRRGTKHEMSLSEAVNLEVKLWRELRGFLAILGLSPADRARVAPKVTEKPKQSKWAGIISGVK